MAAAVHPPTELKAATKVIKGEVDEARELAKHLNYAGSRPEDSSVRFYLRLSLLEHIDVWHTRIHEHDICGGGERGRECEARS